MIRQARMKGNKSEGVLLGEKHEYKQRNIKIKSAFKASWGC